MRCHKPYVGRLAAFPCGRCAGCLSDRRRTWAGRLMLEALAHGEKAFVTLTYRDERKGESLSIKDVQDWLKRLRKLVHPRRIRYFAVGEYGDRSGRAHYHAILFGYPSCRGFPVRLKDGVRLCECGPCQGIRRTWGQGHVMVSAFNDRRAMYICGYVLKKMTDRRDPRLFGREPEFARMSLRPGIGALACDLLVKELAGRTVPPGVEWGGRQLPLGRYLRRKVAMELCNGSEVLLPKVLGLTKWFERQKRAVSVLRAYSRAVEKPVGEVLREALGLPKELVVVPEVTVIHRPTITTEVI